MVLQRKSLPKMPFLTFHTKLVVYKLDIKLKRYGVFLDLSKDFDSVYVPTLITKLGHIGIRCIYSFLIFRDYPTDRSECVNTGSFISSDLPTHTGVPLCSILGPTLTLYYIKDLCLKSLNNFNIFAYADDTAFSLIIA